MPHKKQIGLFFGSFNPVHVGHLALANFIVENTSLEEIWFVVSPQNPFKKSHILIDASHRIEMLKLSIKDYLKFKVCDIELQLPTPSYTHKTLERLRELHTNSDFSIIMGADNLEMLMQWANVDDIIQHHGFMVYPRPGYPIIEHPEIKKLSIINAPVFNIDSTSIRKGIEEGKEYRFLIPTEAYHYIHKHKLYR